MSLTLRDCNLHNFYATSACQQNCRATSRVTRVFYFFDHWLAAKTFGVNICQVYENLTNIKASPWIRPMCMTLTHEFTYMGVYVSVGEVALIMRRTKAYQILIVQHGNAGLAFPELWFFFQLLIDFMWSDSWMHLVYVEYLHSDPVDQPSTLKNSLIWWHDPFLKVNGKFFFWFLYGNLSATNKVCD